MYMCVRVSRSQQRVNGRAATWLGVSVCFSARARASGSALYIIIIIIIIKITTIHV